MFIRLLLTLLQLALLVCIHSSFAAAQQSTVKQEQLELGYILEPFVDKNGTYFRVDLRFKGNETGTTKLVLPNRWGGQPRLYQAIRNLLVDSPDTKLSDTNEPHIKVITHRPNQTLHIRYELIQDFAGLPQGVSRDYYRPILQKDYFHWIGHGAWLYPQWNENEIVRVFLQWKNLPKGWTLANSFGANQKKQRFRVTIEDFVHAVFVGGDFRIQSIPVGGKPVYTAVRGSWQFSDAAFADMVQKIIKVEREFWSDYGVPYYLLTLLPLEAPPTSVNTGGTGLTNSFANFATRNAELDYFKYLLAHEYFHNWNSRKLGRLKDPETLLYWFSEGFTDYYTYLLLLRGGLITLDDYIRQYNSRIHEYYLSPVRTVSNQRVLQDFWNDDDVHDLPYRRGFLLAMNWNALIRSHTAGRNSLDDAMREMFRAAQGRKPELTAELISEYITRFAGRDVMPDVQRHIENGETIVPDRNALGSHVEIETVNVAPFELGFDLEMLRKDKVINGVKETSAAYRAGLRNGQVVVKRMPIYIGDITKPVELTVKDGEGERVIRFYPASQNTISVPQFKLRPGLNDTGRAETLRWLGITPMSDN
jgi:predicted metalloprotease with PDZ domain